MKYLILVLVIFSILCTENRATAQTLPNASFENWYTLPDSFGAQDPTGWTTTNYMFAGRGQSNHVSKSTNSHLGGSAVQMRPTSYKTSPGGEYVPSIVCNGKPLEVYDFSIQTLDIIKGGTRISTKPTKLTGFYSFIQDTNFKDSAYAIVILKKYNASTDKIDTVSYGSIAFSPVNAYTKFEINIIDLRTDIQPDSIVIAFFNKASDEGPNKPQAKFLIDNLSLTVGTDIKNPDEQTFKSAAFPNPATNSIVIPLENTVIWNTKAAIEIANSTGEKVEGYSVEYMNAENSLRLRNLDFLPSGMYYVSILNDGKNYSYNFTIAR